MNALPNPEGPETSSAGLRVCNLKKVYPTRGEPLVVLDGIELDLPPGDTLAIVGPSGCGKSTLLHILGTLDTPSEGTVRLNGLDPHRLPEPELARFRNRQIGFVFQDHYLLPQCTVLENALMPTLASGEPVDLGGESVEERARRLIDRVGLSERVDHLPAELSGGERQRVAMARALVLRPSLILCDEPTGNLDRTTARSVGTLLMEVHREEKAMLVVVTHSVELAALFDRRGELDQGKLSFGPREPKT